MTISSTNFLLSMACALAAAANETAGSTVLTLGGNLWTPQADESVAVAPYAVLRPYGGPQPDPMRPFPAMSVQAMVRGIGKAATALADSLFQAMYDDEEFPRTHWTVAGKKIDAGTVVADGTVQWEVLLVTVMQQPAPIGVDDKGRSEIVFNFDVQYQVGNV